MKVEYSSCRDLIRESDMAWNRLLTAIPSQPDEGLLLSDLIVPTMLFSLMVIL